MIISTEIPEESGIYFIKENRKYLYIGKSLNLRARLNSHPRIKQLKDKEIKVIFKTFLPEEIDEKERYFIDKFKPIYNGTHLGKASIKITEKLHYMLKIKACEEGKFFEKLIEEVLENYLKINPPQEKNILKEKI